MEVRVEEAGEVVTEQGPEVRYLGLAGRAGAGKDFVRSWLCERSRLDVLRVGFADEVRREVSSTLGLTCEQEKALFTKPYPREVRRLLQWWGTDLRRAEDSEYWVRKGIGFALELGLRCPVDSLIVFTDVRFENEAKAIREIGGKVLEVVASHGVREKRTGITTPGHASEMIDFETDGWIDNGVDGEDPVVPEEFLAYLGLG